MAFGGRWTAAAALGRTGVGTSSSRTVVGILVTIFGFDVLLVWDGSQ